MFNQTAYSPTHNNNLNINAVSGMLVKNHPKSFIVQCSLDSNTAKHLFNTSKPYWQSPKHQVVVLQVLLCGNDRVMCEIVFKENWDEPLTCGNVDE